MIAKGGFYYLLCVGHQLLQRPADRPTSVFASRSASPTGPFVDREGISLLAGRVGGTPVISDERQSLGRHRP